VVVCGFTIVSRYGRGHLWLQGFYIRGLEKIESTIHAHVENSEDNGEGIFPARVRKKLCPEALIVWYEIKGG